MEPVLLQANIAARYACMVIFLILGLRVTLLWKYGYSIESSTRVNLQRGDWYTRASWVCIAGSVVMFGSPINLLTLNNVQSVSVTMYYLFTLIQLTLVCLGGVFKIAALGIGRGASHTIVLPYLAIPSLFMLMALRGWL